MDEPDEQEKDDRFRTGFKLGYAIGHEVGWRDGVHALRSAVVQLLRAEAEASGEASEG